MLVVLLSPTNYKLETPFMGFLFASTGGLNRDNVVLNNVLRYEPTLDKWIKVANMNKSRARHGKPKRIGCNVLGTIRDIVVL